MKKFEIILLVLGIGIAFAEITLDEENKNPVPEEKDFPVLEIVAYTSDLENGNKTNEVLNAEDNLNEAANIIMQELQKSKEYENAIENKQTIIDTDAVVPNGPMENENLDVNNINWDGYHNIEDDYVPMQESDFYYKDLLDSDPKEIMETAAGFVPIPILKRRQKPRRQFANRRYFRRPYRPYPSRRFYHYPYYRYYYPGSLRFY